MKTAIILICTGLFLFGCASGKKTTATKNGVTSQTVSNATLVETHWKLTELMGQPVITDANNREMYISLKKEGNMVMGNDGCNSFRGTYTLQEAAFRISFSPLAATLMACVNMEKGKEFMEVLGRIDNYAILGNTLSLNKARMAPLARFEAVTIK